MAVLTDLEMQYRPKLLDTTAACITEIGRVTRGWSSDLEINGGGTRWQISTRTFKVIKEFDSQIINDIRTPVLPRLVFGTTKSSAIRAYSL